MRVEFNQGLPDGCIGWLIENVGRGNIIGIIDSHDYGWFYERISRPGLLNHFGESTWVPTITVKDEKLAVLFILRWS